MIEIIQMLDIFLYMLFLDYITENTPLYKIAIPYKVRRLTRVNNVKEDLLNNKFINGNLRDFANSKTYINNQ